MLRPRPRRRRCDARVRRRRLRADGPGLPGLPQRMRHRDAFGALTGERSSLCSAIGRAASIRNSQQSPRGDRPSHRGRRRRRPVTGSKARPNALAICAAGVAMRAYALLAAAQGAVRGCKSLTGEDWKACEARSELCREDAEPPRSTPSASDPSPSRRGRREGSCAGARCAAVALGTARRRRRSPRGLAGKGGGGVPLRQRS